MLKTNQEELKKALQYLSISLEKIYRRDLFCQKDWANDDLEILEAFAARFSRAADLAVKRYLRSLATTVLEPAQKITTTIDLLNLAEKHGWISSAKVWLRIREMRNACAHEYHTENLRHYYHEFVLLAPTLLELETKLP